MTLSASQIPLTALSLIHASHVIAVHFRTVAEANNFWRDQE